MVVLIFDWGGRGYNLVVEYVLLMFRTKGKKFLFSVSGTNAAIMQFFSDRYLLDCITVQWLLQL